MRAALKVAVAAEKAVNNMHCLIWKENAYVHGFTSKVLAMSSAQRMLKEHTEGYWG